MIGDWNIQETQKIIKGDFLRSLIKVAAQLTIGNNMKKEYEKFNYKIKFSNNKNEFNIFSYPNDVRYQMILESIPIRFNYVDFIVLQPNVMFDLGANMGVTAMFFSKL